MTTFGVIGAMEEELQFLKKTVDIVSTKEVAGMEFNVGLYGGKSVVLVKSGIGKVNAAVCTQILIDLFGVDAVVNTGIAGSTDKNVHLGDVVVSKDLAHHDFDTTTFGAPKGMIPRLNMRFF
ncbi:MAG: 5'-methylthioadenosine/S-adenosylhomocysteine nucleosidase, partial [Clostridiales bacterium]|nr:5'-methylthioadenosine/S-adenosylhomocysteine nucleosidase [Clostridiales bacterium]